MPEDLRELAEPRVTRLPGNRTQENGADGSTPFVFPERHPAAPNKDFNILLQGGTLVDRPNDRQTRVSCFRQWSECDARMLPIDANSDSLR
ncbi:hypothetical protein [Saccharopolyspora shandongensis]|uniref:hypothetical protein n=1 Tax=Saccharopolyspora shandongensis TaxID=418495 RepID=UPI0033C08A75